MLVAFSNFIGASGYSVGRDIVMAFLGETFF